ncbi:MAG: hypothetical protein H6661_04560 [Ardenticatenaceae bacterium]|nr:hypothetical protein [Ardenticatenaceae bacterium]
MAIVAGLKTKSVVDWKRTLWRIYGQIHFAGIALALASLWIGFRFRLALVDGVTAGLLLAVLAAVLTVSIIWRNGDGAKAVIHRSGTTGCCHGRRPFCRLAADRPVEPEPGVGKILAQCRLDLASGAGSWFADCQSVGGSADESLARFG